MASVNYMKMKSVQQVKATIMHCDKEQRMKHDHTNTDINKDLTRLNIQSRGSDYKTACKKFDDLITDLDSRPGANKRKDRVICFGLNIPVPEKLDKTDIKDWTRKVIGIVKKQYGSDNVIGCYLHRDEIHDYIDKDTHEHTMSREHLHMIIVPEHDGKLNGKWFSNKWNMTNLNYHIHEMTENDYGTYFMNGSKKKGPRVEVCKRESERLEIEERQKDLEELQKALTDTENNILQKAEQIKIARDRIEHVDDDLDIDITKMPRKIKEDRFSPVYQ